MKTTKALFGILTITVALAVQVQAQTSNLVTTLVMQFSSAQYPTTPVLPLGGSYFFLVSGRYGTGPGDRGEAEEDAAWATIITDTLDHYHNPNYGWQWNGTSTNRPTPDVYQTNHVYRFDFTGRGAAEVLTFTDSYYPDNVGTLTFQLYQISQAPFTDGLVAYYPLNGNANDASGNGNNGIVTNAMLTTDRFNQPSNAYYFNATNSSIRIPAILDAGQANYTISFWFNTGDTQQVDQYFIGSCPNPTLQLDTIKLSTEHWGMSVTALEREPVGFRHKCTERSKITSRIRGIKWHSLNRVPSLQST